MVKEKRSHGSRRGRDNGWRQEDCSTNVKWRVMLEVEAVFVSRVIPLQ